jgi:alpha-N-arabinofuranosidase
MPLGLSVTPRIGNSDRWRAWRQPIFFPFQHAAKWGRGTVLDGRLACDTFETTYGERFPDIVSAAVIAEDGRSLAVFCVNRNFEETVDVQIDSRGLEIDGFVESLVMRSDDLGATNTADDPERVRPQKGPAAIRRDGCWRLPVLPASWSVFRFGLQKELDGDKR